MSWSIKPNLIAVALVAMALLMPMASLAAEPSPEDRIRALVEAYPESIAGSRDGMLLMKDGPAIRIDDAVVRNHGQKLAEGDIEDSLVDIYRPGGCEYRPAVNSDPGRIRSEALMKRLYGGTADVVRKSLVPVSWFGETLRVTARQGVATALAAARDDLADDASLKAYLSPSAGVFNWRKVAGQPNLSVHGFGAAIDINTKYADYWVWSGGKPGKVSGHPNKFPMKIVEIFERHGFIWGGRWYHYDTMHFEYRPEMLKIASLTGASACR